MLKRFKLSPFKLLLPALLCSLMANAQKLPNVQQVSLRAPANIKIDGAITEWDNKLQAYNKSNQLYYSIANDDKNLYLAVKATRDEVITKIALGGLTLIINPGEKKRDKNSVAVTFPAYNRKEIPFLLNTKNTPPLTKDTVRNNFLLDSFRNVQNRRIGERFKMIGVIGVAEMPDSAISRYNQEGVKAAALFDSKLHYIYELAFPLKYLGSIIAQQGRFSYNIRLNGAILNGANVEVVGDGIMYTGANGATFNAGRITPEKMMIAFPTDFWGDYVLAK